MSATYPPVPALEHDRMMAERFGHTLGARGHNERRIVWRLMHHLAAAGFPVCALNDGEEVCEVDSPTAAMELIFNLDDSRPIFRTPHGRRHSVYLILGNGNGGWDLVTDWNYSEGDPDGFNAAMEAFLDLLNKGEI